MPLKLLIQEEGGKHRQVKAPEHDIWIVMFAIVMSTERKKEQNHLDLFFKSGYGHVFPHVVEVSLPTDPKFCTRDLYEICFGTSYVNDRTHICEG